MYGFYRIQIRGTPWLYLIFLCKVLFRFNSGYVSNYAMLYMFSMIVI